MLPEMICHVQRWMKRLHECASRGYFGERKRNYEYHFNLDVHAVINTLHDTNRVEDKEKRIFKFIGEMPRWTSSVVGFNLSQPVMEATRRSLAADKRYVFFFYGAFSWLLS